MECVTILLTLAGSNMFVQIQLGMHTNSATVKSLRIH